MKGVVRRDDTILRLGGIGDNFHMTWAADGQQLVMVNDGAGWEEHPKRMFNHRMFAITDGPYNAKFAEVENYPFLAHAGVPTRPRYYGWGTLAIDQTIYQFLSTSGADVTGFSNVKLIYSPDGGRVWHNQDGSTPVVWNELDELSRKTMVFYDEPQHCFSQLSCLQMGRAYSGNRDGYAYVYAPNGVTEGTMNQLVLFRAPKQRFLDRASYEYFSGWSHAGDPLWSRSINDRAPVHNFPAGWVGEIPFSWVPSVVYNVPLGLYMMVSYGWKYNRPADHPPREPSYLGFWTAVAPWGPWKQVHEDTAWAPGGDVQARVFQPQIAPKWIAADGRSFWLVWSDYQGAGSQDKGKFEALRKSDPLAACLYYHRAMKHYAFNVQRVDIVT